MANVAAEIVIKPSVKFRNRKYVLPKTVVGLYNERRRNKDIGRYELCKCN